MPDDATPGAVSSQIVAAESGPGVKAWVNDCAYTRQWFAISLPDGQTLELEPGQMIDLVLPDGFDDPYLKPTPATTPPVSAPKAPPAPAEPPPTAEPAPAAS